MVDFVLICYLNGTKYQFNNNKFSRILLVMANGVNTQWFDLQVKHGNYLAKEKEKTLYQVQKEMKEKHEEQNKLENKLDKKSVEQIKDLQDDLDFDDQFMRDYMAKRKAELLDKAKKHKYGEVIEISRDQYIKQVTEANPQDFVVIHLYQDSNQFCGLINQHLTKIAAEQPHVKFIKMISTKCIQNFPDSKCPCFIIYKAGKPVANITNVDLQIEKDVSKLPRFLASQGVDIELQ